MYEHFKQLGVGSQVENDGSWFAIAGKHVIRGIHANQTTHTVLYHSFGDKSPNTITYTPVNLLNI